MRTSPISPASTNTPKPLTAPPGAIVIFGPQGCGKTIHGAALAKHFGKTRIVDDWHSGMHIPKNAIALTHEHVEGGIPFADAIRAAGIRNTKPGSNQ